MCLVAIVMNAQPVQLQKGKIMVGVSSTMAVGGAYDSNLMSLGFSKTKYKYGGSTTDEYSSFIFNLLPKGGYFFMDNLAGGLEVIFSGYRDKDAEDGDTYTEYTLGVGPFVRYYYPLDKIYPFVEAETLFGTCKEYYVVDNEKSSLFMFGVSVGAALPVGDKVTFDGMIGYLHTAYKYSYEGEGDGETSHEITGGIGLRAGITIYLSK